MGLELPFILNDIWNICFIVSVYTPFKFNSSGGTYYDERISNYMIYIFFHRYVSKIGKTLDFNILCQNILKQINPVDAIVIIYFQPLFSFFPLFTQSWVNERKSTVLITVTQTRARVLINDDRTQA